MLLTGGITKHDTSKFDVMDDALAGEEPPRAGAWRKERRPLSREGSSSDLKRVSVKIDPRMPAGLTFGLGPKGPAVIKTVAPDAQLAYKCREGDRVVQIDGARVHSAGEFARLLSEKRHDTSATVFLVPGATSLAILDNQYVDTPPLGGSQLPHTSSDLHARADEKMRKVGLGC